MNSNYDELNKYAVDNPSDWVGMVGAVGKISAFRPQGPQFDPGSAKIRIFVRPSFPPKPTQLSILPG